jgi:hypothetical protein
MDRILQIDSAGSAVGLRSIWVLDALVWVRDAVSDEIVNLSAAWLLLIGSSNWKVITFFQKETASLFTFCAMFL